MAWLVWELAHKTPQAPSDLEDLPLVGLQLLGENVEREPVTGALQDPREAAEATAEDAAPVDEAPEDPKEKEAEAKEEVAAPVDEAPEEQKEEAAEAEKEVAAPVAEAPQEPKEAAEDKEEVEAADDRIVDEEDQPKHQPVGLALFLVSFDPRICFF